MKDDVADKRIFLMVIEPLDGWIATGEFRHRGARADEARRWKKDLAWYNEKESC
jgi:hypothetical protein